MGDIKRVRGVERGGTTNQKKASNETHVRDPAEDVGMKGDMMLRYVEPTLKKDITLKSTAVIYRMNSTHQRRAQRTSLLAVATKIETNLQSGSRLPARPFRTTHESRRSSSDSRQQSRSQLGDRPTRPLLRCNRCQTPRRDRLRMSHTNQTGPRRRQERGAWYDRQTSLLRRPGEQERGARCSMMVTQEEGASIEGRWKNVDDCCSGMLPRRNRLFRSEFEIETRSE
jgi:hypothetical protein